MVLFRKKNIVTHNIDVLILMTCLAVEGMNGRKACETVAIDDGNCGKTQRRQHIHCPPYWLRYMVGSVPSEVVHHQLSFQHKS